MFELLYDKEFQVYRNHSQKEYLKYYIYEYIKIIIVIDIDKILIKKIHILIALKMFVCLSVCPRTPPRPKVVGNQYLAHL